MIAVLLLQLLAYVHTWAPLLQKREKVAVKFTKDISFTQPPLRTTATDDGCMSLAEYKLVTAGTAETAENAFKRLDPDGTDCLTADKISHQFDILDKDKNGDGDFQEFSHWYTNVIFGHPVNVVG